MDQDWKIERREVQYVYIHIRVAHLLFRIFEISACHQMVQVAFQADVAPVVVAVHLCLYASSVSVDSSQCHFGKEGSRPFDFHEWWLGIFVYQPLPCYAREKQQAASSLPGLRCKVCWLVIAFPQLRRAKPSFGYCGHVQGKMHVGLFKLYPTSLSCHSSWHVENLRDISCCFSREIRLLPQPYTTPEPTLKSLTPVSCIPGNVYNEIRQPKSQNGQDCDVQFRGLWWQMPWSTMEVSRYGQW